MEPSAHLFFRVENDERYSVTLDRAFVHQTLRIGYSYNGPTEIGRLILLPVPAQRGRARQGAVVRAVPVHTHASRAVPRSRAVGAGAPLPGPTAPRSCGSPRPALHRVDVSRSGSTLEGQQSYALFPDDPVHTELLPDDVRAVIGQVGEDTRGVEKMLRRIGFDRRADRSVRRRPALRRTHPARDLDRARREGSRRARARARGQALGDHRPRIAEHAPRIPARSAPASPRSKQASSGSPKMRAAASASKTARRYG